jgi:hypothetical protein
MKLVSPRVNEDLHHHQHHLHLPHKGTWLVGKEDICTNVQSLMNFQRVKEVKWKRECTKIPLLLHERIVLTEGQADCLVVFQETLTLENFSQNRHLQRDILNKNNNNDPPTLTVHAT